MIDIDILILIEVGGCKFIYIELKWLKILVYAI